MPFSFSLAIANELSQVTNVLLKRSKEQVEAIHLFRPH